MLRFQEDTWLSILSLFSKMSHLRFIVKKTDSQTGFDLFCELYRGSTLRNHLCISGAPDTLLTLDWQILRSFWSERHVNLVLTRTEIMSCFWTLKKFTKVWKNNVVTIIFSITFLKTHFVFMMQKDVENLVKNQKEKKYWKKLFILVKD